jgi:biotin transport system substrate-specific component
LRGYLKYVLAVVVLCFVAPASIEVGLLDISFQTLVILVIGAVFRPLESFSIVLLYILLGAIGLPVYSGYVGGYEKLLGVTAGFFLGFLIAAPVVGLIRNHFRKSIWKDILILVFAHGLLLVPGFVWLRVQLPDLDLLEVLWPLLPGLFIKSSVGAGIVFLLEKNLTHLKT